MARVDALIVTALPMEFDAARSVGLARAGEHGTGALWKQRDSGAPYPYLIGEFIGAGGRDFSVALARPVRMGGRCVGPLASILADRLEPACLAMSGVCAGNPAVTALGDVVVAEVAYAYDEGTQRHDRFEGDFRQVPLDGGVVRAAQDLATDRLPSYGDATDDEAGIWFLERLLGGQEPRSHPARDRYFPAGTWSTRLAAIEADGLITRAGAGWALTGAGRIFIERALYDDVDGPERLPFKVVVGPMASANVVVRDGVTWNRLATMGVRSVAGLDMEAAAVATVAQQLRIPNWLVAKGVMDHADPNKDDRYKRFAARTSAEVMYALLARLP